MHSFLYQPTSLTPSDTTIHKVATAKQHPVFLAYTIPFASLISLQSNNPNIINKITDVRGNINIMIQILRQSCLDESDLSSEVPAVLQQHHNRGTQQVNEVHYCSSHLQ